MNLFTKDDLKKAFEAGQQMIWEDLEQTERVHKYDSFEDWVQDIIQNSKNED